MGSMGGVAKLGGEDVVRCGEAAAVVVEQMIPYSHVVDKNGEGYLGSE